VLNAAADDKRTLFVGIDPDWRLMVPAASRSERAAVRGRRNALFVCATAESPPDELAGVADEVLVQLPSASLLSGIVTGEPAVSAGLRRLARPGARLDVIIGVDASRRPPVPAAVTSLPELTESYVASTLAPGLAAYGWAVDLFEPLGSREVASLVTTCGRRLRANTSSEFVQLRATAKAPTDISRTIPNPVRSTGPNRSIEHPRLRVLGELDLSDDAGVPVDVRGRRLQALLCVYAMDAGRPVRDERAFDALWPGDDGPADPAGTLRTYVTRLRRALGPGLLPRSGPGYRLDLTPEDVDVTRFERAVEAGRAARNGDPVRAHTEFQTALALWRGEPWLPLAGWPDADADAVRCRELYAQAVEQSAACLIAIGDLDQAVTELTALAELDPTRELRWELLMIALARAGRHADALRAYQRARLVLTDRTGLDPSPRLHRLETAVLNQQSISHQLDQAS
jgi:DNA-binding SARP family transcriptional activator